MSPPKTELSKTNIYIAAGSISDRLDKTVNLDHMQGLMLALGERENAGYLRTDRHIAIILNRGLQELKVGASLLHYLPFFKDYLYTGLGITLGIKNHFEPLLGGEKLEHYSLGASIPLTLGYSFDPICGKEQFIQIQALFDQGAMISYGRSF